MKRITALPVKGESYLLEHLGKKILIDGGYSSSTLVPALKAQLGLASVHLDIVICTHNDDDHAGGLTDLAEHAGISVSEFWLPGSWKEVVKDLVESTKNFYNELVQEVTTGDKDRLRSLSNEDNLEIDSELFKLTSNLAIAENQNLQNEGRRLELRPSAQSGKTTEAAKAKSSITKQCKDPLIAERAKGLIETAERIRAIAASASLKGIPVRWFDYLAFSRDRIASGGESFMQPINAKELLFPPELNPFELRRFITLSRVNRESLVFLSSNNDAHVDVLFCGDSPLGDGHHYSDSFLKGKSTAAPLIATAPHHGAESNNMAYGHIAAFGPVAFWIRSGGKSYHPESTYQSIPAANRTCTHCPHNRLPHQSVVITDKCEKFSDPQAWLTVRAHDCSC